MTDSPHVRPGILSLFWEALRLFFVGFPRFFAVMSPFVLLTIGCLFFLWPAVAPLVNEGLVPSGSGSLGFGKAPHPGRPFLSLLGALTGLPAAIGIGGISWGALRLRAGSPPAIGEMFTVGLRHWRPLLLFGLVNLLAFQIPNLVVLFGLFVRTVYDGLFSMSLLCLGVVGGLYLLIIATKIGMTYPAIVVEGLSGAEGMVRSWGLARGNLWYVVVCVIVFSILPVFPALLLTDFFIDMVALIAPSRTFDPGKIFAVFQTAIGVPFIAAGTSLLFFYLRRQREESAGEVLTPGSL